MRKAFCGLLGLALLVPAPASAEFQWNPNAVTFGVGPAMLQDNIGTTFFLSGRVDLATFTEKLVWDTGLHWWQKTETTSYTFFGETSEIKTSFRDLAVASGVKFLIPVKNEKWLPYARGGIALNFIDVSLSSSAGGTTTESVSGGTTDFGIYLGGGGSYRYSPRFLIGAEATMNITDADHFLLGLTASFPF